MKKNKPTVQLTGQDGNAFAIIARVRKALRNAGRENEIEKFMDEATSGDYNHLLQTCIKYVNVK